MFTRLKMCGISNLINKVNIRRQCDWLHKYAEWYKGVFEYVVKRRRNSKHAINLSYQTITIEKYLVPWSPNWVTVPTLPLSFYCFGLGRKPGNYLVHVGGNLSMDVS